MSSTRTNGDITRRYIERRYKNQQKSYDDIKNILNDCSHLRERISIHSPSSIKSPPKALFILGSAGSGKSYVLNQLLPIPLPSSMYLYNPDQYVETLMDLFQLPKKDDIDAHTDLEASILEVFPQYKNERETIETIKNKWTAATIRWFLGQGKQCSYEDFNAIVEAKASIIIDRPGDSLTPKSRNPQDKSVYQQMEYLDKHDYQIYIVVVTADLDTCLKRNRRRARSLPDHTVDAMWHRFDDLIPEYQSIAKKHKWSLMMYDNNDTNVSPSKRITLSPGTPSLTEWLSSST